MIGFALIYSIMAYGISAMLVYFNGPFGIIDKARKWISSKQRPFDELFSCMFCLPTNIGIALSFVGLFIAKVPITPFSVLYGCEIGLWYIIIPLDAAFTGAIVYIIDGIEKKLESE